MSHRSFRAALPLAFLALLSAGPAAAQWQIKVGEDSNVKIGVLFQGWADWSQDAATQGYSQNLFVRRFRILVGGQIVPGLTFFAETDDPNLGKGTATKNTGTSTTTGSGFIIQDAYVDWKAAKGLTFQAGLFLMPFCRNCGNGATGLMALDYGSFSFVHSGATGSVTGRDTGFQVRGYVLDDRLEYRLAAVQGNREPGSRNAFRYAGRAQVSLLDKESVPFFYPGTYFGKKKMLILGGGFDMQQDYKAYAADAFFDYPVGKGGVTAEVDFTHYDGGTTLKTLKAQSDWAAQIGLYAGAVKLFPYFRYEKQHFTDAGADTADQQKVQVGLGYFIKGNNATVKAAYTRVDPKTGSGLNQFTIQVQGLYF